MIYSEKTIRRKARNAGYIVKKGFQHYLCGGAVCRDVNGDPYIGYNVQDMGTGIYEWGCYNEICDHLWTLQDVDDFLRNVYERAGIEY